VIEHIGGIQAPTQAHLNYSPIALSGGKPSHREAKDGFKKTAADLVDRSLMGREQAHYFIQRCCDSVDTHAFAHRDQMRRGVQTDRQPCLRKQCRHHGGS